MRTVFHVPCVVAPLFLSMYYDVLTLWDNKNKMTTDSSMIFGKNIVIFGVHV